MRPSIDRAQPDVQVLAHLDEQTARLYIDLSGESLFKRGWRADKGEAPIKENLAAALLLLAGWTPEQPLLDPFCGSGTIAIEAACMAAATRTGPEPALRLREAAGASTAPPGPDCNSRRAPPSTTPPRCRLVGRDISTGVIDIAQSNAVRAGLAAALERGALRFEAGDARAGAPPAATGMIVTNPPYGEQSAPRSATVPAMMGDVATQLKRQFAGWQAWLLSSDRQLPRQMHLREARKIVLFNGALECRLFRFDMVAGSNRK